MSMISGYAQPLPVLAFIPRFQSHIYCLSPQSLLSSGYDQFDRTLLDRFYLISAWWNRILW
jgi:hypothetical protein